MRLGETKTGADVLIALRAMHWESRRVAWFFERYDVLLTPTLGKPPVRVGELATDVSDAQVFLDRLTAFIPYTPLANCTGEPSMSVPLSWNGASLPVGAMFTARYGAEAILFRLAGQLEQARPWARRRPPVWG
jgi:Asp-tRNA(Asn)/Glu-tRNA(Gln) amidotransferase A subunit family amidase